MEEVELQNLHVIFNSKYAFSLLCLSTSFLCEFDITDDNNSIYKCSSFSCIVYNFYIFDKHFLSYLYAPFFMREGLNTVVLISDTDFFYGWTMIVEIVENIFCLLLPKVFIHNFWSHLIILKHISQETRTMHCDIEYILLIYRIWLCRIWLL